MARLLISLVLLCALVVVHGLESTASTSSSPAASAGSGAAASVPASASVIAPSPAAPGVPYGAGPIAPPPPPLYPSLYPGLTPFAPDPAAFAIPAAPIGLAASYGGPIGTGYVAQTPLGAIKGVIGDLIVPIIIVGVVIFAILGVVWLFAVLFNFKLDLLNQLFGGSSSSSTRPKRAADTLNDQINQLTNVVLSAISSGQCMERILCESGLMFSSNKDLSTKIFGAVEKLVPADAQASLKVLSDAAQGLTKSCEKYVCFASNTGSTTQASSTASASSTTTPKA